jgi:D-glycero-D-manno-heptose 1,7-bisphosphate phosphatase
MKLLILDKDGTLVRPKSGERFVQSPKDQELLPGVADALTRYRADGWVMAVASNQGGVASQHKTLGSAIDEMFFAMRLTSIEVAMAAHSYENQYGEALFLDLTDGGMQWKSVTNRQTKFRKPNNGMIRYLATRIFCASNWQAMPKTFEVLFVGDRPEDEGAANAAGVDFMWASDWVNSAPSRQAR